MPDAYDIHITEDGILQTIYREGQEPVEQHLIPHVVTGFKIAAVDEEGDKALIIIFSTQHIDEHIAVAMEPNAVRSLLAALYGAYQRTMK